MMTMQSDHAASGADERLDGNAAAGVLQELFRVEITTAVVVCAGCGASGPVGRLTAFVTPMGAVVRCPGCGSAIVRAVQGGGRIWLDMRGAACLEVVDGSARPTPA